jgi:transcriptional regulator with XRE-family HTH domain
VLRSHRERHTVCGPPWVPGAALGPADVGRALRNERVRQGLSYRDVSRRLGIPEDQLRAAESGTLRPRADQLSALKTVRRFADLLGLPGDRYALAILESWPTTGPVELSSRSGPRDAPTATTPSVRAAGGAGVALTANDDFGPFTPFGAESDLFGATFDPRVDGLLETGAATGIVPAVPIATTGRVVRRNPMPWPLRATAGILAAAVVVGGALLAVDQLHPSWLRGIGLVRSSVPASGATAAHDRHRAATHSSVKSTGTGHASSAVVTDALRPHATSGRAATLDAGRAPVQLTVSAVGGPCWAEVTSPTSATPLFDGVLAAGTRQSFTVTHGAVIELGSASGRVSAASHSGHLSTYSPPVAPFTLSVRSSS